MDNVSFSVNEGEVFAFLGMNGAGKTTMFKMITRQEKPTCGQFHINGINMCSGESDSARKYIGYCTQEDVLFEYMTAEDHIKFYAKIKGIPANMEEMAIDDIISHLNFGKDKIGRESGRERVLR